MMGTLTVAFAIAATLSVLPFVSAHGFVSGVVSNGQWYAGSDPSWIYAAEKPNRPGWYAYNQDWGYVAPSEYNDQNITCHEGATPGTTYVPVKAGESIQLQWTPWPDSHHGPVLNYLARCPGECTDVQKSQLNFFKIEAQGLYNGTVAPGTWASDKLISTNNTWTLTIPSGLSGNFVLRHEIIALHAAENKDGAQNYPNCINLKVSGSGTDHPCRSGSDCRYGPKLYTEDEPGILINIYTTLVSYKIPGPALWTMIKKKMKCTYVA